MEQETITYYDGTSTRPLEVRVLVFHDYVHLYKDGEEESTESFPVVGTHHNQLGNTNYLYLDKAGLKYLKYSDQQPFATIIEKELDKHKGSSYHKLLKQKLIVLVPFLLALGLGIYVILVNLIPYIGMKVISVQQEITMGEKLKTGMLSEGSLIGEKVDKAGTIDLQTFADGLRLSNTYPIKVTLVNSDIVNAYALPGGYVVVYKGILKRLQTPEELAALLAHESTHINQRHTLRSLLRSASNGIILSIFFGDASGISGAIATNVETLTGLQYSRSLETEADAKGMDLLLANKVDVNGMRLLMQRLHDEEKLPESLSFISTHPMTAQRIESAKVYAAKHPQKFEEREDLKEIFLRLKQQNNK